MIRPDRRRDRARSPSSAAAEPDSRAENTTLVQEPASRGDPRQRAESSMSSVFQWRRPGSSSRLMAGMADDELDEGSQRSCGKLDQVHPRQWQHPPRLLQRTQQRTTLPGRLPRAAADHVIGVQTLVGNARAVLAAVTIAEEDVLAGERTSCRGRRSKCSSRVTRGMHHRGRGGDELVTPCGRTSSILPVVGGVIGRPTALPHSGRSAAEVIRSPEKRFRTRTPVS